MKRGNREIISVSPLIFIMLTKKTFYYKTYLHEKSVVSIYIIVRYCIQTF